jgi:hypothetical protein
LEKFKQKEPAVVVATTTTNKSSSNPEKWKDGKQQRP